MEAIVEKELLTWGRIYKKSHKCQSKRREKGSYSLKGSFGTNYLPFIVDV